MTDDKKLAVKLSDRVLYADGESVADLDFFYKAILNEKDTTGIYVSKQDAESEEVKLHNKRFPKQRLESKQGLNELQFDWNIPNEYKELDLKKYFTKKFKEEIKANDHFTEDEIKTRYYRMALELKAMEKRNLFDMLRTVIYIVNTFEDNNVIWGTGRGSSCASYLLYLVGLHQVDSVLYELDISEFLR